LFRFLINKAVSLGYWIVDSKKSFNDLRKLSTRENPLPLLESKQEQRAHRIVFTAHVFYEEFAFEVIKALSSFPKDTKVLITTTSSNIKDLLTSELQLIELEHDVRVTPNIGRNFGPLLVEFSKQLVMHEFFIHVHSKKSLHKLGLGKEWKERSTHLLMDQRSVDRIFSIFDTFPNVGLVFADTSGLLRPINFRWGRSRRIIRRLTSRNKGFDRVRWKGPLSFPPGGMFSARTEAILPLLAMEWTYDLFDKEENQKDGTLQHGIERMIGELSMSRGYNHAVFHQALDMFFLNTD
jgi:lipopolysaccharide biosynthesis protein